jgi:hypothetical protein
MNPFRNEIPPPVAYAYHNKQSVRGYSVICEHCLGKDFHKSIDFKYIDLSSPIKGIANLGA